MTVLEEAMKRAGYNGKRCHGLKDGSIVVVNRATFVPSARWLRNATKVGRYDYR